MTELGDLQFVYPELRHIFLKVEESRIERFKLIRPDIITSKAFMTLRAGKMGEKFLPVAGSCLVDEIIV